MSSDSGQLVVVTASGLYCPPGYFHIDPKEAGSKRRHHPCACRSSAARKCGLLSHVPAGLLQSCGLAQTESGLEATAIKADFGARQ